MKILLLAVSLMFLASCNEEKPQPNSGIESDISQKIIEESGEEISGIAEENDMCICTKDYRPVCGSNGITYGNPCMAGCAKIKEFTEGACK